MMRYRSVRASVSEERSMEPAAREIRTALDTLALELAVRRELPHATDLAETARALASEAARAAPDQHRINRLLAWLADGTQGAGDLAVSVATLRVALFGVLELV